MSHHLIHEYNRAFDQHIEGHALITVEKRGELWRAIQRAQEAIEAEIHDLSHRLAKRRAERAELEAAEDKLMMVGLEEDHAVSQAHVVEAELWESFGAELRDRLRDGAA